MGSVLKKVTLLQKVYYIFFKMLKDWTQVVFFFLSYIEVAHFFKSEQGEKMRAFKLQCYTLY